MKKNTTLIASIFLGIIVGYSVIGYLDLLSGHIYGRIFVSIISIIISIVLFQFLLPKVWSKYNDCKKSTITYLCYSFVFSVLLMIFAYRIPHYLPISLKIIVTLGIFILIQTVITYIIFVFSSYNIIVTNKQVNPQRILLYALPIIIICAIYLIAFYPGIMGTDSILQWKQITSFQFNDWHPVTHTLFLWLITRLWLSPAAIVIVQILISSLVFGYCAYTLEKAGLKRVFIYALVLAFSFNFTNHIITVTLWKDVLFSEFLFLFTIIIFNIFITKGKWISSKKNIALFIVAALGILFFRHSGKFCFFPMVLILMIFYKEYIKKIGLATLIVLTVYILIVGPGYKLLNVIPSFEGESYSVTLNVIGAVIKNDGNLTDDQKIYAQSLMPMNVWKETYDPYIADPLKNKVNYDNIFKDRKAYFSFLFNISAQNPELALKGYLDITSIIWRIPENRGGYTYSAPTYIEKNDIGLASNPISKEANSFLTGVLLVTLDNSLKWLFWRPALAFYIILLFSFISFIKNGKRSLLIPMVSLLNIATYFAAIPAQDFRYLYASTLVALPIVLFSLFKVEDKSELVNKILETS